MSDLIGSNHKDEKTDEMLQIRIIRLSKRNVKELCIEPENVPLSGVTDGLKAGEEEKDLQTINSGGLNAM